MATSRGLAEMRKLTRHPRVKRIAQGQCACGPKDPRGEGLLKKPTAILAALEYTEDLERRRTKDRDHATVFGSRRGQEGRLQNISRWSRI